ncbi:MAG: PqqD family protein [Pseudomonadota bacterium]
MKKTNCSIDLNSIYTPSEKLITREIEGELIIVPIESGIADFNDALYSLNETGRAIWNLLEQKKTVSDICSILSDDYSTSPDEIKNDVLLILEELLQIGIIIKV